MFIESQNSTHIEFFETNQVEAKFKTWINFNNPVYREVEKAKRAIESGNGFEISESFNNLLMAGLIGNPSDCGPDIVEINPTVSSSVVP